MTFPLSVVPVSAKYVYKLYSNLFIRVVLGRLETTMFSVIAEQVVGLVLGKWKRWGEETSKLSNELVYITDLSQAVTFLSSPMSSHSLTPPSGDSALAKPAPIPGLLTELFIVGPSTTRPSYTPALGLPPPSSSKTIEEDEDDCIRSFLTRFSKR